MKTMLMLMLTACLSFAGKVEVSWDANPESLPPTNEHITYQVMYGRSLESIQDHKVDPTDKITVTIDNVPSGEWFFTVVAIGETGLRSEQADPVSYTVPLTKPTGVLVVKITASVDLKKWETIAVIPQDPKKDPIKFIKAEILTIDNVDQLVANEDKR